MRLLDSTLLSSMDSGNYDPYFLLTISDTLSGNVLFTGTPVGYELSDLELIITVQMPAFLDVPFYRTAVILTRGTLVLGTPYTLSTSKFTIIKSTWDGSFQTFKCHLIPRVHYSAPGDQTYSQVITAFCAYFGKTAVFLTPAAAWLSYQFLPTGKTMTLNDAQTFFQQLKQKYFIFACDNGSDEILFYTAFTNVTSPQYSIPGYRFAIDYNVYQKRQYIWRDEAETLHQTSPSFSYSVQLQGNIEAILSLVDLGAGVVLAGSYKNDAGGGKIFRSTDYGQTWDTGFDTGYEGVFSMVNLGGGILLAAGYYGGYIYRSTDYGVTWEWLLELDVDTTGCLIDLGNGIVLCGHTNDTGHPGCQVWKSVDYGLTWAQAAILGTETNLDSMVYLGSGVCIAGTALGGKIFRSTNYGDTWTMVQQLGSETGIYCLLNLGDGIVLAGTNPGGKIYKSTNSGTSWALAYDSPEQSIYTLNTLGSGIVLAGTGMGGKVYRSLDYGAHWAVIATLGTEQSVRSFVALGNGVVLAGTGEHAMIYKSLNCGADLDIIHNLGFLPSTAVEPSAYTLLAPPKFDPFMVHLKYQSSDYIRVNLTQGGTYDFTCAQVTEVLDLKSIHTKNITFQGKRNAFPYYMVIGQTEWLTDTATGPLPSTIERVASYTPLVTANFEDILTKYDNNLQAAMDRLDNHTHGPQLVGKTNKPVPNDADLFDLVDSLTLTHLVRNITWAQLKAQLGGGSGGGDMYKVTYDTDNDGIVDAAEAVPWAGVSGKPVILSVPKGFISGLKFSWNSGSSITCSAGLAELQSTGALLEVSSPITKSGLNLSANTWYHCYLFDNGGTADLDINTTPPAAPYAGTARSKTGDTGRRYLFSIRNGSAGGNVKNFLHSPASGFVATLETIADILTDGRATVYTDVDMSPQVPVTSQLIMLNSINTDTVQNCVLKNSLSSVDIFTYYAGVRLGVMFPCDASQKFQYKYSSTPTNGFYANSTGYFFER